MSLEGEARPKGAGRRSGLVAHFSVPPHQIEAAATPRVRARQLTARRTRLQTLTRMINDFLADPNVN